MIWYVLQMALMIQQLANYINMPLKMFFSLKMKQFTNVEANKVTKNTFAIIIDNKKTTEHFERST